MRGRGMCVRVMGEREGHVCEGDGGEGGACV